MYPRTFDTLIRVKPDAIIQSYYSDRLYKASVEMGGELEVMAVLEAERSDIPAYVFRLGKIAYGVAPEDVEILDRK
jgi:hypothetical protein